MNTVSLSHATTSADASTVAAPTPRGPLSAAILDVLVQEPAQVSDQRILDILPVADEALASSDDVLADDDVQLSLFLLYLVNYGPGDFFGGEWEWQPALLTLRGRVEKTFEQALRDAVPLPTTGATTGREVAGTLFALTSEDSGPSLSRFIAKKATDEQLHEFLMQRSIYTLREADPHSWGIARLRGKAKAALVEIQSDEYGGGRLERMHARIFAQAMAGLGLETALDYYLDVASAETLASMNTMSLFGLNRRLRGSIAGHLAAFEMTSSIPNRQYGNGFRRLGYGENVTWYFDEHVEADAVHEQIAANELAGGLADDEPELIDDILFGAAACLYVDGRMGEHMLNAWSAGETSLYEARA